MSFQRGLPILEETSRICSTDSVSSTGTVTSKITGLSTQSRGETSTSSGNVITKFLSRVNRRIWRLKVALLALLLTGTCLAAFFMYDVSRSGEQDLFQAHYTDNAIKLLNTFEGRLRRNIAAIDNYAVVSTTEATKDEWPFVVAPRFEVRGASSRTLAGAGLLAVLPKVTEENLFLWEDFARNNSDWIEAGQEFEETVGMGKLFEGWVFPEDNHYDVDHHEDHHSDSHDDHGKDHDEDHDEVQVDYVDGVADNIFKVNEIDHLDIIDNSEGPFFPLWQTTPVQKHLVNYNLLTHGSFGKDMKWSTENVEIVFGRISDVSDIHDPFHFVYRPAEGQIDGVEENEEGHHEASENHEEDHHKDEENHEDDHHVGNHRRMGESHDPEKELEESHDHEDEHQHNENHMDSFEEYESSEDYIGVVGAANSIEGHGGDFGSPTSMTFFPIFDQISEPRKMVGVLAALLYWREFLVDALAPQAQPLLAVLSNECGQFFSFRVIGTKVDSVQEGDFHDQAYNGMSLEFHFRDIITEGDNSLTFSGVPLAVDYCAYTLTVYPTNEMEDEFLTSMPALYAGGIVLAFLFAFLVFFLYDVLVSARQNRISRRAEASSAVINSLFPATVRDRLFPEDKERDGEATKRKSLVNSFANPFLSGDLGVHSVHNSLPIADLFPRATVMFADIAGFTAWASSREPTQVFMLLESLYGKFDVLAKRKKVFKVETIGDCYVAATGVPEPQEDHAIRMVHFAIACSQKVATLTKQLESSLGPDTGGLQMRFGIHSGPVTAGVLRGDKSRFQLFGDTMNMASRMESTGEPGRIHCSETTANLLIECGRTRLLEERFDSVNAKGKGKLKTFWIVPRGTRNFSLDASTHYSECSSIHSSFTSRSSRSTQGRMERLVDWNVELLQRQLSNLLASREHSDISSQISSEGENIELSLGDEAPITLVKEAILMPGRNSDGMVEDCTQMSETALSQLRHYVQTIAKMYKDTNPFHNFDHSSHVLLSAQKMLSRIVGPPTLKQEEAGPIASSLNSNKSLNTNGSFAHGITSDPLTHFAILFSAMIHDVDHTGVSNQQLIKENSPIAKIYQNKSVAEQNSIDIAWGLLMEAAYDELRDCIFTNQEEHDRFRNLLVNSVIATDIFDPDLKKFRQKRWDMAFSNKDNEEKEESTDDLKCTIVIEHLIQASDVAHTMQHWHVYQKWNKKLFLEMTKAFQEGRMEKDPASGWYQGELWFFDNYVIPLAKKLFECQVFGVSSDEYLHHAMENRREWEAKGQDIIREWIEDPGNMYEL